MLTIWLKSFSVSPRINVVDVCVLLLGMVVVRESVMMGLCVVLVLNLPVLFRVKWGSSFTTPCVVENLMYSCAQR